MDPADKCLSSDSAFSLTAGVGTFMGSICEPNVMNIRLKFSATSTMTMTTVETQWSPTFNVTGEQCTYMC